MINWFIDISSYTTLKFVLGLVGALSIFLLFLKQIIKQTCDIFKITHSPVDASIVIYPDISISIHSLRIHQSVLQLLDTLLMFTFPLHFTSIDIDSIYIRWTVSKHINCSVVYLTFPLVEIFLS
jgi:hypothetical protein